MDIKLCCSSSNPCKLFWAPHSTVLDDDGGSASSASIGALVKDNKEQTVIYSDLTAPLCQLGDC